MAWGVVDMKTTTMNCEHSNFELALFQIVSYSIHIHAFYPYLSLPE